ncbi:MAG: hypothetical protein KDE19_23475 [Caldilineaceae bacterium]|nr:hypothetical protein [Caldilineaceae bacterium]
MRNQLSEQEHEEFLLLMSLALDDFLDEAEQQQFALYQERHPILAAEWQDWQAMHQRLNATPHAVPAPDFVDRFELRLLQQERRRRLWQGVWIGLATFCLWFTATAGLVSVGTYLFVNQSSFVSSVAKNIILFFASLATWFDSLLLALNTFASTPQAMGLGAGYLVLTMGMLVGWFFYLRRSTQLIDVQSA